MSYELLVCFLFKFFYMLIFLTCVCMCVCVCARTRMHVGEEGGAVMCGYECAFYPWY